MKIFLIGLPGCGKSTLGKVVADSLGRNFVDLDNEVVKGEGRTITYIFGAKGEDQFRIIERSYLDTWCAKVEDFVMATGGGTPCFLSNIELINKSGISIFLDTPVGEIANRMMKTELAKRPLFAGQDLITISSRVQEMHNQRIEFYEKANVKLSGDDITKEQIVKEVLRLER